MAKTYRIVLKSPDGSAMFTATVAVEEVIEIPTRTSPSSTGITTPARSVTSVNGNPENPSRQATQSRTESEPPMTEPQRRYLFRLLGAQGLDPKQAEAHLKTYFNVGSLRAITKSGASQLIEQMVADQKSEGAEPPANAQQNRR